MRYHYTVNYNVILVIFMWIIIIKVTVSKQDVRMSGSYRTARNPSKVPQALAVKQIISDANLPVINPMFSQRKNVPDMESFARFSRAWNASQPQHGVTRVLSADLSNCDAFSLLDYLRKGLDWSVGAPTILRALRWRLADSYRVTHALPLFNTRGTNNHSI